MIVGYGRNDRQGRTRHHVCRIKSATKTSFKQHIVRRVLRKGEEGCSCRNFKKGDWLIAVRFLGAEEISRQILFRDMNRTMWASQRDAFVEPHQMRRCKHMHTLACRLQNGLEVGDDRTLAIGPGHMDDPLQAFLRVAEGGE